MELLPKYFVCIDESQMIVKNNRRKFRCNPSEFMMLLTSTTTT